MQLMPKVRGQYRANVDLAKFCWFQVGGPAAVLFKPEDVEDLQCFLAHLPKEVPYFVFGVGSNLLVRDEGFKGVVIRLGRGFNRVDVLDKVTLGVGAATLDVHIAQHGCEAGIDGLEFLSGVPGTFGGALAMNAGAYGVEMKDVLLSARAVNGAGELREFAVDELGYRYRCNGLEDRWVFVDGVVRGMAGDPAEIAEKIAKVQEMRATTQPIRQRTSGSTFKNPEGHKAWQLIERAGCRGLRVGGAMVSEMHCNFFINTGDATAADLLNLIGEVKQRVYRVTGVLLQEEIKVL